MFEFSRPGSRAAPRHSAWDIQVMIRPPISTKLKPCIRKWCRKYVGCELPVTCKKDFGMIELWDDRCIQVIPNTGRTLADELDSQKLALAGKAALQS